MVMTKDKTVTMSREPMLQVPRALLEALFNADSVEQHEGIDRELRAMLAAPVVERQEVALSIPDECPHLIVFDDTERETLMFSGAGARSAALKTWEQISMSWNAHLFVRVERNSRDDRYPSASTSPPAPVAVVLPEPEQLFEALAGALGEALDCTRVWSAWGVGTMSEDDFVQVADQSERLHELASACLDKVKEMNQ